MVNFEAECIERYFLGPGSMGPVGSVYVADQDLLEIFSTDDPAAARSAMLKSLPHHSILRARLSGEHTPIAGRTPDYVRILVFLCWMQTTTTRIGGERDFRDILENHLNERFQDMSGLNPMWEHLRDFLERDHGINLVLPDVRPHVQIGRTLRIAFPTWRDRDIMRKIMGSIPYERLLDPLTVANRIKTSRHLVSDSMQSFDYNFQKFDLARKRGGREFIETPFWQAWYTVVAQRAALEDIEVAEGDFGEHELFRVSPLGDRVAIITPEDAIKFIPKPLAKLIRGGLVFLESLGFGKYRASTSPSNILLMKRSKLSECPSDTIRTVAGLNGDWIVAGFKKQVGGGNEATGTLREFAWRDGIRVGGAYLGRTPLAPIISGPMPAGIKVERNGKPVDMISSADGLRFPDGVHVGPFTARSLRETREILLVPRANEVGEARRLSFDFSREVSEDEFHQDTAPSPETGIEEWSGTRVPSSAELITIGEALYERTARGLSFSEAVEIILRGLPAGNRPSEWDVLRSFADAGWLELTLLRHFPVRRILQNPLTAESTGSDLVRVSGPTPMAVVERLHAAAGAAGATIETWNGLSQWSLPRYVARCGSEGIRQDFIRRMAFVQKSVSRQARAEVGDPDGIHGYREIGRLDERGFFAVRYDSKLTEGLFRFERRESRNPFLYRSVIPDKPSLNYVSASVGILSHHLRGGGSLFVHDMGLLQATRPRLLLPSSWARWASDRVLCNAAPCQYDGEWRYRYAVGASSLAAISRLVPVEEWQASAESPGWIDRFLASASNRARAIYDSRSGTARIGRGMLGKRQS